MLPETYRPERWIVPKDAVYAAIRAVDTGLEYAHECLFTHDESLGRSTLENRTWAERMEADIRHMETTLATLRSLGEGVL